MQRNRLLSAAVRSLDEVGYANASVAHITSCAHVSRRTFYEHFATREECLLAVFENVVALVERELLAAKLECLPWRERVRLGLWTILSFFERESMMARVCVVHSLQGEATLLARRELLTSRLAAIVDEGRNESTRAAQASSLTAEGLVGAALSIVYTRLLRERREPLTDLLGELMGLIVLPYLGLTAAKREQTRPVPVPPSGLGQLDDERFATDPLEGISMRLTYRTMRVLECVAAQPGASNRRLSVLAGVPDQGQMSKLLSRLERLGLLVNTCDAGAKGEPNEWRLTAQGLQVTQTIGLATGARQ
jgi:AcrR family transcriptional regulator